MTSVQFSRLKLLRGSLKGTVHIQFRFVNNLRLKPEACRQDC